MILDLIHQCESFTVIKKKVPSCLHQDMKINQNSPHILWINKQLCDVNIFFRKLKNASIEVFLFVIRTRTCISFSPCVDAIPLQRYQRPQACAQMAIALLSSLSIDLFILPGKKIFNKTFVTAVKSRNTSETHRTTAVVA